MKHTLTLIFVFLIAIATAQAFTIPTITNTSIALNITANVNYAEDTNFKIINNDSSTIYNVTCINTDEFKFQPLANMLPYEERYMNLTYKTNVSYARATKQVTCYSLKRFDIIQPQTNKSVSLSSIGFNQSTITLKQDDVLTIYNPQTARTIEELNFGTTTPLNSNSSIQFTQSTIGNYRLRDSASGHILYITLETKAGYDYVRNAAEDKIMNLDIESIYQTANTSFEIFTNSFTMELTETKQGSGRIKNLGNFPAVGIEMLSNDWITFNKNNYSIAKNQEDVFIFTITPKGITKSDQTNKTYQVEIILKGKNFVEQRQNISVFLNYREDALISANVTNVISVPNPSLTREFCKNELNRQPDSDMSNLCVKVSFDILNSSNKLSEYYRNYVLRDASSLCSVNVSSETLEKMFLGYSNQGDRENNLIGHLTENSNDYKNTLAAINNFQYVCVNESKNTQDKVEGLWNNQNDLHWGMIAMIVVGILNFIVISFLVLEKQIAKFNEKHKQKKLDLPEE